MTFTRCAPNEAPSPAVLIKKKLRWFTVAFGLLLGLAAVCHGCHRGDHDDELSVGDAATKRGLPTGYEHESDRSVP